MLGLLYGARPVPDFSCRGTVDVDPVSGSQNLFTASPPADLRFELRAGV